MRYKALLTLPKAWEDRLASALEILRSNGIETELVWSDTGFPQDELIDLLSGKHAHMMSLDVLNKAVITASPDLRVIAKHGIGLDNIDVKAATEAKIPVCNTPGSNSYAVADLTIGLLLAVCRKIGEADSLVRQGKLQQMMGMELYGKEIGIIGFGAIGKQVALRALGFGMHVNAYDTYMDLDFCKAHSITSMRLDDLVSKSDFVTLHIPLTQETKGLFDAHRISLMKKGAILVNVARGGVVDEDACADALVSGHLAGAGFDVFSKEPPQITDKLFTAPHITFTTHMAGCTKESITRSAEMAATNIVRILSGERVPSIVNKEIYQ